MTDEPLQPSQEAREAARRAAADYLIRYNEWSPDEAQKIINGHKDHLATVSAFIGLAGTVNALASSSDGLREAVERFIADYDDGDRADAGCSALMDGHVSDFRAALSTNPSSDAVPKDLLDRAERAWQRFFYPAADCFINDIGDKHLSVDLEVADCLRLVMGAIGHHVRTPDGDVPLSPSSDADALREALEAEDAYWAASRAYAAALPRLREPARITFELATIRRQNARAALQPGEPPAWRWDDELKTYVRIEQPSTGRG